MAIITLTSDMGLDDFYVASVKGTIYKELDEVRVVDITHQIDSFNIAKAAFAIKHTYSDFPKKTIHIVAVDTESTLHQPHLLILFDGHYFIGPDNGLFSLVFERAPEAIYELDMKQESDELSFPAKHIYARAAAHIARGGTPEIIAKAREKIRAKTAFNPIVEGDHVLKGAVIYIDKYGNIISNITRNSFQHIGKGRDFVIWFRKEEFSINKLSTSYSDVEPGELLAMFSSLGYLEIAINKGSAKGLFATNINDIIRVEFK